jgi:hypothetical protein
VVRTKGALRQRVIREALTLWIIATRRSRIQDGNQTG